MTRYPIECCERTKRIHFRITTACNANCTFCLGDFAKGGKHEPLGQVMKSLELAKNSGLTRLILSGGEPTIHPQFVQIVMFAKQSGFKHVQVITNGIRFADLDFAQAAIKAGLDEATFSIHGHTAELHDSLTATPGSFKCMCEGVKNLQKSPNIILSADVVICKQNEDFAKEIAGFVLDVLGIRQDLNIITVSPAGRAWENRKRVLPEIGTLHEKLAPLLGFLDGRRVIFHVIGTNPKHLAGFVKYCQDAQKMAEEAMVRKNHGFFATKKPPCIDPSCAHCTMEQICPKIFDIQNKILENFNFDRAVMSLEGPCNNNCAFCNQNREKTNPSSNLEGYKKTLDALSETGAKTLVFSGSEPTANPNITGLVSYAASLGFAKITMNSNGRMFSDRRFAGKIADAGLDEVEITLLAHSAELHDWYAQTEGSFNQAIAGVENAFSTGMGVVSSTVLLRRNFPAIEDLCNLLLDLDFKKSVFRMLNPNGCVEKILDPRTGVAISDPHKTVPKLSLMAPFLERVWRTLGTNAKVRDVPLCMLANENLAETREPLAVRSGFFNEKQGPDAASIAAYLCDNFKCHSTACDSCKRINNCGGVFEKYAWMHDFNELRPIR